MGILFGPLLPGQVEGSRHGTAREPRVGGQHLHLPYQPLRGAPVQHVEDVLGRTGPPPGPGRALPWGPGRGLVMAGRRPRRRGPSRFRCRCRCWCRPRFRSWRPFRSRFRGGLLVRGRGPRRVRRPGPRRGHFRRHRGRGRAAVPPRRTAPAACSPRRPATALRGRPCRPPGTGALPGFPRGRPRRRPPVFRCRGRLPRLPRARGRGSPARPHPPFSRGSPENRSADDRKKIRISLMVRDTATVHMFPGRNGCCRHHGTT